MSGITPVTVLLAGPALALYSVHVGVHDGQQLRK